MEELNTLAEKLRNFEEKEKRRLESINKSKQRPEYKNKVKDYNKQYYLKKDIKRKTLKNILIKLFRH